MPRTRTLPARRNAVWRVHFFAGLVVLPVLAWLAITGALYLYKPEIDHWLYRDWIVLDQPRMGPSKSLAELTQDVTFQTGGRVLSIASGANDRESLRFTVDTGQERLLAFVDPRDGVVLGTTVDGGAMETVKTLHSLIITGPIGNAVTEIVAGWAIVLVITGVWLWWPRGNAPALALRGPPRRRRFWRDLHASTGAAAGTISAPIMWWKRGRQGRPGSPPGVSDASGRRGLLVAMAIPGILFPLTGATMIAAYGLSLIVGSARPIPDASAR